MKCRECASKAVKKKKMQAKQSNTEDSSSNKKSGQKGFFEPVAKLFRRGQSKKSAKHPPAGKGGDSSTAGKKGEHSLPADKRKEHSLPADKEKGHSLPADKDKEHSLPADKEVDKGFKIPKRSVSDSEIESEYISNPVADPLNKERERWQKGRTKVDAVRK